MSRNLLYAAVAGVSLLVAYGALFVLGSGPVDTYVEEDGVVETVGAIGLFTAAVFFLLIAITAHRRGLFGRFKQLVFVLLAIAFVFGAGEEISWGQRLIGLETPEELREVNAQDELNVHNLDILNGALGMDRLFQIFWFGFGVLLPIAAALSARVRETATRWLPILPLWIAGLLIGNQLIAELTTVIEGGSTSPYAGEIPFEQARFEVTEAIVATIFALGAGELYRRAARRPDAGPDPESSEDRPAPAIAGNPVT